jgi:ADP-ribose pyrophosphatase
MELKPWKKLSEEVIATNPWWEYRKWIFELPSGKLADFHLPYRGDFVMVVPVRNDGKLLMVNGYRPFVDSMSLEFPAGGVESGEDYEVSAQRELNEEGQVRAEKLDLIGEGFSNGGGTNARYKAYLGTELSHQSTQHDETEEFELHWYSVTEIDEKIHSGDILDCHTISVWYQAQPALKKYLDQISKSR